METPNHYYPMFEEEIKNVWENWDKAINFDNIIIEIREKHDALMSIRAGHKDYTSKASGLFLRRRFGFELPIKLYITPRAMELSEDKFRAYLRHEALHIGYPRHDLNFQYYVKKINAPLTEYEMEHDDNEEKVYVVSYQPKHKKGARFIKLKEFHDYEKAREYSSRYSRVNMVRTKTTYNR